MLSKQLLSNPTLPPPPATPAASKDLEATLSSAEVLLKVRDKSMRKLYEYPVVIPAELAKLVATKDAAEADKIKMSVSQLALDRRVLIEHLQAEQPELVRVRAAVDAGRLAVATDAVAAFTAKWDRTVADL